jgi:hypothetical protein
VKVGGEDGGWLEGEKREKGVEGVGGRGGRKKVEGERREGRVRASWRTAPVKPISNVAHVPCYQYVPCY